MPMNEELTFNDLPTAVTKLTSEIRLLKEMICNLLKDAKPSKTNTHIPMTVDEVCAYTHIPKATLYEKLAKGEIPATKPGKRYCIYQDELDKWLEINRKNPVPLTNEEMQASILKSHKRKPNVRNF